jgi:hypothetical protein
MTTFIPPARRPLPTAVVRKAVQALPLLALMAVTVQAASPTMTASQRRAAAAQQTQAARTIVDHSVQPAGGACRQCGPAGCKHSHHRDCRDGACVPYCPVRPSTYGFYGTQWRRWPGEGVVPVSNEQAATPSKPPKSSVPGADEESMGPKPSELPEPDFPAGESAEEGARSALPPEPAAPEPDAPALESREPAAATAEPLAPAPVPEGEAKPAQPEAAPAKPRPQDENLFDESAARKVRRKIPVTVSAVPAQRPTAQRASPSRVQPAAHQEAASAGAAITARRPAAKPVPRVTFDPRKESEHMRQQAK